MQKENGMNSKLCSVPNISAECVECVQCVSPTTWNSFGMFCFGDTPANLWIQDTMAQRNLLNMVRMAPKLWNLLLGRIYCSLLTKVSSGEWLYFGQIFLPVSLSIRQWCLQICGVNRRASRPLVWLLVCAFSLTCPQAGEVARHG